MIIECPSCQTKFSVDDSQVSDIDDPRFHCCRCGNYFRPSDAQAKADAANASAPINTNSVSPSDDVASDSQPDSTQIPGAQTTTTIAPPTATEEALDEQVDWTPEMAMAEQELLQNQADEPVEQLDLLPQEEEDTSLAFHSSQVEPGSTTEREPLITADWLDEGASSEPQPQAVDYTGAAVAGDKVAGGGKVAQLLAQARRREDVEREAQSQAPQLSITQPSPEPQPSVTENDFAEVSDPSLASGLAVKERERRSAKRRSSKHQRWITEMERKTQHSKGKSTKSRSAHPKFFAESSSRSISLQRPSPYRAWTYVQHRICAPGTRNTH